MLFFVTPDDRPRSRTQLKQKTKFRYTVYNQQHEQAGREGGTRRTAAAPGQRSSSMEDQKRADSSGAMQKWKDIEKPWGGEKVKDLELSTQNRDRDEDGGERQ
ncbi:hypothetical protein THAOC_01118 [Thalassiosira oceanica]|uniref:Uncharacterized protein n=1 Tax=Thalassiosira oceanica TaxID=159749 RepID=K0TR30_THAOC|nr:hypothetical protein THAOC_01118 [Thalassiosira oceanica]|eukprot:EJK77082.1 hypothetical protein THAOC_01118 [Thalassiosira oceanica]